LIASNRPQRRLHHQHLLGRRIGEAEIFGVKSDHRICLKARRKYPEEIGSFSPALNVEFGATIGGTKNAINPERTKPTSAKRRRNAFEVENYFCERLTQRSI